MQHCLHPLKTGPAYLTATIFLFSCSVTLVVFMDIYNFFTTLETYEPKKKKLMILLILDCYLDVYFDLVR
jgi:hypothetical protein